MIASFFQSLEQHGVDYLLISGQATVLYGAATFSEDIDLWLKPTDCNRSRLVRALAAQEATYYKLTPLLTLANLVRGHGFHFLLPGDPPVFLDIMGNPPRAPTFAEAKAASQDIKTPWGNLTTIGIEHLVELKKTQRLSDYPVIGKLVLRRLEMIDKPSPDDYRWAIDNVFTLPELTALLWQHAELRTVCRSIPGLAVMADEEEADVDAESAVERWLTERMLACQQADRLYWRSIIAELKDLRRTGELVPDGSTVAG